MAGQVLELMEDINGNGTTIVMVTHDPVLAARAGREIRLLDGALDPNAMPTAAVGTEA